MKNPHVTKHHSLKLPSRQRSPGFHLKPAIWFSGARLLLALLLGGLQLQAADFPNDNVTLYRDNSGSFGAPLDGNVGIGTKTPGARLDVNALTLDKPPLLRLQQRYTGPIPSGSGHYFSPLLQLETEGAGYDFNSGNGIYSTLFTVTSSGYVGINTIPNARLHIREQFHPNGKNMIIDDNSGKRSFFIVGKLGNSGYNLHSNPGDTGIFWSDGGAGGGQNLNAGFVIAPRAGSFAGLRIDKDGNVGIGTRLTGTTPNPHNYRLAVDGTIGARELAVDGKISAKEIKVDLISKWPDYVFSDNYNLMPLVTLDSYVKEHKHLPDVPSQANIATNGVNLGEMNAVLLRKVEELTLYVLAMKKENENLQKRIEAVEMAEPR